VIKKNTNPEWNEELTLSIEDPAHPVKLVCIPSVNFSLPFLNPLSFFFTPTPWNSKNDTQKELFYCFTLPT